MFERYTETARKVIFYGRFAASQFGVEYIDTEHLLLGILRADPLLARRVFKTQQNVISVREQIEKKIPAGENISTSVDIPLSLESRSVLANAADQAARLNHQHIATEHLLLGLILKPECTASKIMTESGLTVAQLQMVAKDSIPPGVTNAAPDTARADPRLSLVRAATAAATALSPESLRHGTLTESCRDLTQAAEEGKLNPLIGREPELDRMIRILSRRSRRNPVLIGEPGVGKEALVHGLAQRISDGAVPAYLAGCRIMTMDAATLLASAQKGRFPEFSAHLNVILYIHGLFDLAGKGTGWGVTEAMHVLEPHLSSHRLAGGLQCIATGTPLGYRLTAERAEALVRHFEVVPVRAPTEEETIRVVSGVKEQYEKFHGVTITDEAVETAVSASRWFLHHLQLPDRAIDLIDEAGSTVKLRSEKEPPPIGEIQKQIRAKVREMEKAIANHDFALARGCSDEERELRRQLVKAREELNLSPSGNVVTAEDILEAVAAHAGVSPSVVKSVMELKNPVQLDVIANEIAAQFSVGSREWSETLVAWLASCSAEDAERLAQAIRDAKSKLPGIIEN